MVEQEKEISAQNAGKRPGTFCGNCAECGEEMSIPGLIDKNVQEVEEQYKAAEKIL